MLGRRHKTSDKEFWETYQNIEKSVSRQSVEVLSERAIRRIQQVTKGKKTAFAWSGGKDSLVVAHLLQRAGVSTRGLLGITAGLEYPEMETWYEQHVPEGVEIVRAPYTLRWLAKHQELIFTLSPPFAQALTGFWADNVWLKPQNVYCEKHGSEMLILGRRRADGNFCGPKEDRGLYEAKNHVFRFLPIVDWTQEETIAYMHYYDLHLPPIYHQIHGFKVGTHPWPARQSIVDVDDGWAQVYECDPGIVREAAQYIDGAKRYLEHLTPVKSRNLHVWAGRVLGSAA